MSDAFDIAGASDIGKRRSENQDHFFIGKLRRQLIVEDTNVPEQDHRELFGCQEGHLLLVADGMGGHCDGEQASRAAVEATAQYVLDMMHWFLKLSRDEEQDFHDELSRSLTTIQKKIWATSNGSSRQMGTTVTMAYLLGERMYVVHAGDSRCYLIRNGHIKQMTTDHTIAQQLIDSGALSEKDAALSRWQHVLWNCVGGGERHVRPEAIRTSIQTNDLILLCSDGLTGMVDDEAILSIVTSTTNSAAAVASLIDAANRAGGKDNISVVICRVNEIADCDNSPETISTSSTTG